MKTQEMFRLIREYNKVADIANTPHIKLSCSVGWDVYKAETYAEFRKIITATFIPQMAEAILHKTEFTFNENKAVYVQDIFGDTLKEEILFELVTD